MSTLPTTDAMVSAATDAYDVAIADEMVAATKHEAEGTQETYARWLVASRAAGYAAAVLQCALMDQREPGAA